MYCTQCSVWAPKENQNDCKSAQIHRRTLTFLLLPLFLFFFISHPSESNVVVEFGGQTCYIGGSPSIGSIHQWAGPASGKIYISYQIQTPTDITSRSNFQMVTPAAGGKDDKTPSTCWNCGQPPNERTISNVIFNRGAVKKGYFSVRLTVRVAPSYSQLLVNFLVCVQKYRFFGPKTLFSALFSGSKFSHLLTVRAEGANAPPLTDILTVKYPCFFDDSPST